MKEFVEKIKRWLNLSEQTPWEDRPEWPNANSPSDYEPPDD